MNKNSRRTPRELLREATNTGRKSRNWSWISSRCIWIGLLTAVSIGCFQGAARQEKIVEIPEAENRVNNASLETLASKPIDISPPKQPAQAKIKVTKIQRLTANFPKLYRNSFDRFVQVIAPNGKPIFIFAQKEISDAQIRHVRNVMVHFLTDLPNSVYGSDKGAIANQMANNRATMILCKGRDGQYQIPQINAQPLYADETVVEGSPAYIKNQFAGHRDATLEETLHCVHDFGIGVDVPGALKGAAPEFQKEIRFATNHAMNNFLWPTKIMQVFAKGKIKELKEEGSLTQEYIASVVDSYYGLWGPYFLNAGYWGIYTAKTRDDIRKKDLKGYAVVRKFFHPYLTYNAEIDSSFKGTFSMTFTKSLPYTHKSRYLVDAFLTGKNNSNLKGNSQDNILAGNHGNNVIDGCDGVDTVIYPKPESSYEIKKNKDGSVTVIGDGTDRLINIEKIVFDGSKRDAEKFVEPVPFQ